MSTKTRRSYTAVFKEAAVRVVRESGIPSHRWRGIWGLPIISSPGDERRRSRQRSVDRSDTSSRLSRRNWSRCGVKMPY